MSLDMTELESIESILTNYRAKTLPETSYSSAVMILLLGTDSNEYEVVLTKRSPHLATYAGDYSFPGGMRDPTDVDYYMTAERELSEELSINRDQYRILGQLDDFLDRQGQLVRPFVAKMQKDVFVENHIFSSDEITSIYYFSLQRRDEIKDNPTLHEITRRKPSYSFMDGEVFVWGLTANLLVHLANVIYGEDRPLGKMIKQG